jgi:predicted AAA+ superfamily ATPase
MISRDIEEALKKNINKLPVLFLTGPRQSGKSTLLKNIFPEYSYISLENLSNRRSAIDDPIGFLSNLEEKVIIDEAQRAPELFSYIQEIVDKKNNSGMYILSGSQNFLMMEAITQSLAGRVSINKLLPLSFEELKKSKIEISFDEYILSGGYPRIYDKKIIPDEYYPDYITTYVERDVRSLKNIRNLSAFTILLQVLAHRIGSQIDIQDLARTCGVSVNTIKEWISILEASYIIFLLRPYYKNFDKRVIKAPKIYFYDTGLACSLLNIENKDRLKKDIMYGHLFENMVILEKIKEDYNFEKRQKFYYRMESSRKEIDLIVEKGNKISGFEIKSAKTAKKEFSDNLVDFSKISGMDLSDMSVIYGGKEKVSFNGIQYLPF